jgi:DNA-binding LacI/PurR family transcriptional regulator
MMEITRFASIAGYNVISVFVHNIEEIRNTIEQSKHDRTCGFILHAADMTDDQIRLFYRQDIPTVVCDYESDNIEMDYIYFNNIQAVNLALKHLFDMGHRDIVYFYNSEQIYNFLTRRETFENTMRRSGQPISMIEMGTKIEEIYTNIVHYIKSAPKLPTAVLSENYAISAATIKAFQDCGYKIGKDISIIGIDELPFHMLMDFDFTYVKVMFKSKGYFTIKRLLEKINDKRKDTARIVIDNTLVVGNSVCRIT